MHVGVDEPRHDRLVVAAAAAATLAVIAAPALAGLFSNVGVVGPEHPEDVLTDMGRVVLEEAPHAYQVGDVVVIPAQLDQGIAWAGAVSPDRIAGAAVPLGVRGLTSYRYLPASALAPAWAFSLEPSDRVMADVGTVFFGCIRFDLMQDCSPSLLMQHEGAFYMLRAGLGSADLVVPGAPLEAFSFPALVHAELGTLVLGAFDRHPGARVMVEFEDGEILEAWTSESVVPGATAWWIGATEPVRRVTAYTVDGEVVGSVDFGG